jgi:hypothetical protein
MFGDGRRVEKHFTVNRLAGHVARLREIRDEYRIIERKPVVGSPLGTEKEV